jgi:hypothetical protein
MRSCRSRVDPEARWLTQHQDYGSLPYNGGARGTGAAILDTEIGRRDPPGPSSSTNRTTLPDPGFVSQRLSKTTEDKSTSGAVGDRCNGGSQDPALRGTPGATAEGLRRVFTGGFPHHVEEFIPSHPFTVIPTAGGVASAAAAEPRIEPAP